jgi:hypothetical protein
MKKTLTVGLLLIFIAFTCQAQKICSKENLEEASLEELNICLEKAQKLKKNGINLSIAGPLIFGAGYGLATAAWSGGTQGMWQIGLGMFVAGPIITLIGLPMLFIGSSRVKRINEIKHSGDGVKIDLAPSGIYNCATQNYLPGISLKLKF